MQLPPTNYCADMGKSFDCWSLFEAWLDGGYLTIAPLCFSIEAMPNGFLGRAY